MSKSVNGGALAAPGNPACCVIVRLRGIDTNCGRGVDVRVGERGYCAAHAAVYASPLSALGKERGQ